LVGPYFTTHKGVRQGDPFSPLLFNIAADGLACMIQKAKEEGMAVWFSFFLTSFSENLAVERIWL
jgi:predicted ABC-type ATPase